MHRHQDFHYLKRSTCFYRGCASTAKAHQAPALSTVRVLPIHVPLSPHCLLSPAAHVFTMVACLLHSDTAPTQNPPIPEGDDTNLAPFCPRSTSVCCYASTLNLLFLVLSSDAAKMTSSCVSCPGEPTPHFWLPMSIKAFPELSTLLSAVPVPGGGTASHFTLPGHA